MSFFLLICMASEWYFSFVVFDGVITVKFDKISSIVRFPHVNYSKVLFVPFIRFCSKSSCRWTGTDEKRLRTNFFFVTLNRLSEENRSISDLQRWKKKKNIKKHASKPPVRSSSRHSEFEAMCSRVQNVYDDLSKSNDLNGVTWKLCGFRYLF